MYVKDHPPPHFHVLFRERAEHMRPLEPIEPLP
jgi:hypothetical protein